MKESRTGWLIVLAEAEAFRWVVRERRMAFSSGLCRRASGIAAGDDLVLYLARGAWHNPTLDRSQIAGLARVVSPVKRLRSPVTIRGREFTCGCQLALEAVLPERHGVPMRPLVEHLSLVRRKDVWGQYFRAGLVRLPAEDLATLRAVIAKETRATKSQVDADG